MKSTVHSHMHEDTVRIITELGHMQRQQWLANTSSILEGNWKEWRIEYCRPPLQGCQRGSKI